MLKRRVWLAHLVGLAAVAILWAVAYHFWYGDITWWVGPLIMTFPTYGIPKHLMKANMAPRDDGFEPYDPYYPERTPYRNVY